MKFYQASYQRILAKLRCMHIFHSTQVCKKSVYSLHVGYVLVKNAIYFAYCMCIVSTYLRVSRGRLSYCPQAANKWRNHDCKMGQHLLGFTKWSTVRLQENEVEEAESKITEELEEENQKYAQAWYLGSCFITSYAIAIVIMIPVAY